MSDQIGFTASIAETRTIAKDETVVCPNVITNDGNGYDSKTGIFIAPKSGMYVFSVIATSQKGSMFKFRIFRKGVPCATAFANTPNACAMGGNTVVLTLELNDQVCVKAADVSAIWGDQTDYSFTFTGFMVGQ
ncbi:hypothetical protein BsWGS_03972 [Bradybaena similaris]